MATSKKPAKTAAKAAPKRPKSPAGKKAASTAVARAATPKAPAVRKGTYDLVIVESPAKAKTINKYLGPNFVVLASYGHVRDLPRRRQKGEDIAGVKLKGWVPTYVVEDRDDAKGSKFKRKTKKQILNELRKEASKANRVYLATDPDREGEAIAWHIKDELKLDADTTFRIAFQEITRSAVQQALANPGKIDQDRVKAQEARRILDRVVGYPLSNLLGQKVTRGLSAGPGAIGGRAPDRRAGAGDRGVQGGRVLEDRRDPGAAGQRAVRAATVRRDIRESEEGSEHGRGRRAGAGSRWRET